MYVHVRRQYMYMFKVDHFLNCINIPRLRQAGFMLSLLCVVAGGNLLPYGTEASTYKSLIQALLKPKNRDGKLFL